MSLIFIDCEAYGGAPSTGALTEFGAVAFEPYFESGEWVTFHGELIQATPDPQNPSVPMPTGLAPDPDAQFLKAYGVFVSFDKWIAENTPKGERAVMVSDNPAFDFQWINDGFWKTLCRNPLGHSARRIGDYYAGLVGDFRKSNRWKRLRVTKHDHNPVHDAMGNVEAFARMLRGER